MAPSECMVCAPGPTPPKTTSTNTRESSDVIRAYQSKNLYDSYKMINLSVYRERISKSFNHQVIATSDYAQAKPLLVIFHDPPEVIGVPDPVTNRLDLHNTWLADAMRPYIGWAISEGFAVIDVNIPKFLTGIDVSSSLAYPHLDLSL